MSEGSQKVYICTTCGTTAWKECPETHEYVVGGRVTADGELISINGEKTPRPTVKPSLWGRLNITSLWRKDTFCD